MTPTKLLDVLRDNAHSRACVFGENDSSVVVMLEMRKCVLELIQAREELARALGDALSTYRHDDKETLVTAERQEAWAEVLKRCGGEYFL
jgi:dipeptidase